MSVRIVRLGTPRMPDEGLRIGTVRRPPRGVPKARFARDNWYDVWFPNLAPSAEAVAMAMSDDTERIWKMFVRRYRREMAAPEQSRTLDLLAAFSHQANFSVGCYCADESRCHRSILKELLVKRGARLALIAVLTLVVSALVPSASRAQAAAAPHRTILTHAAVFNGTARWLRDRTIVVDDSMITAIDSGRVPAPRAGETVIDVTGRFVIPGLIDTHVHLATDPDGEDVRPRALARLASAIRGGVTTVRDMAGDTRRLSDYARDAAVTDVSSPDIRYAALFAGPAFFADPRTHAASAGAVAGGVPWMRAITDTTDLRHAVAEARGTGATAIKLYAALDSVTVARVVAEAHRQGMLVWAHAALRPAMPRDMAASGLDAMSHGNLVALAIPTAERAALRTSAAAGNTTIASAPLDSVLRVMAARRILFDPTLFVMADVGGLDLPAAVTRRAHQLGVLISTGTDSIAAADSMSLPNVHQEIALLVTRAGFTPAEALVAATENGARTLGIYGHVGSLVAGKRADLVVLAADPLADIHNTTTVRLVMKRGVIYRRDR